MLVAIIQFNHFGYLRDPQSHEGADKVIKLWDANTGEILRTLEGHSLGVSDIAWSFDGAYIASASDDKTIRIWSLDLVCLSYHFLANLADYLAWHARAPQSRY